MKRILFVYVLTVLSLVSCNNDNENSASKNKPPQKDSVEVTPPNIEYGFNLDSFQVYRDTIKSGQTLSHILSPHKVDQNTINISAAMGQDSTVNFKYVKPGREYLILSALGDTSKTAQVFIYDKNKVEYAVIDLRDSIDVQVKRRPTEVKEKMMTGEIVKNSNLTFAIQQQTEDYEMTAQLSESLAGVFAWSVDFFKLHPGDAFKMIYEEKSVEGVPYGVGDIKAAWFKHRGHEYYTFFYVVDSTKNEFGYYDENGKEAKRKFLMAPVKYSRISSGYTKRRYHPVQKRYKAHLGTDYAAPSGTPIYSTANGTVIAATRSKYNGIYVKVQHDDTYTTQYLHMSKIASGIKKGVLVKQGQVIGYVGSTGLATGPHVCYRFWVNGKQVDHRALKFPPSTPMKEEKLPEYLEYIEPIKEKLDKAKITEYRSPEMEG